MATPSCGSGSRAAAGGASLASVDERVAAGPRPPGPEPGGRFADGARGPAEPAAAVGVLLLALAIQAAPLPLEARFVGSYVLLVVLPGWLLVGVALGPAGGPRWLERGLLALGAGYGLAMLLGWPSTRWRGRRRPGRSRRAPAS